MNHPQNDPRRRRRRSSNTNAPNQQIPGPASANPFLQPGERGRNESEAALSESVSPTSLIPPTTDSGQGVVLRPQQASQPFGIGELTGFGFPPGGPLVWDDWNVHAPLDFGEFSTYYQPQGELAQELQTRQPPTNDFSNPVPIPSNVPLPVGLVNPNPIQQQSPIETRRPSAIAGEIEVGRTTFQTPMSRTQGMNLASGTQTQMPDALGSRSHGGAPASATRAGQKRKAHSDTPPVQSGSGHSSGEPSMPKRPSMSKPSGTPAQSKAPRITRSQVADLGSEPPKDDNNPIQASAEGGERLASESTSKKPVETPISTRDRKIAEVHARLTTVLPAGKVFPIQIGSELFRLSGASLSSDAPSYFSHYFGEQLIQTGGRASQVKTLYIDRDPLTFRDVALHLQGYFVKPRDEEHFVRLFADAQFYSLPRLTQQLFKSEIYIQVGDRHFAISRDIFSSPGDLPNYFSLGFAHFFSTPSEVFPGLDRQTLLRPPSILPPSIPNRSGEVFADILRLLQGYDLDIRDAAHRAELLRDARYFHLKGLEQRLLPCEICYNALRGRSEILLRLEDVRQSGVSFSPDPDSHHVFRDNSATSKPATPLSAHEAQNSAPSGWIMYQRPFIDDASRELILEISTSETMKLDLSAMRASFTGQTKARIASLFQVIANKLNLPATVPLGLMMMQSGGGIAAQPASPANSGVSGDRVRIRIEKDAWVQVDGDVLEWEDDGEPADVDDIPRVRKWKDGERNIDKIGEWILRKGQWRLRVEPAEDENSKVEVSLCAVRIEAHTEEVYRNEHRGFLV